MIITEKFEHFTLEWDMENPENVLFDAYDVSYDIEVIKLIKFVSEIHYQIQQKRMEKEL